MFSGVAKKIRDLVGKVTHFATQRRQKRLAKIAELEKKELRAIVEALTKKIAEARTACEKNQETFAIIEVTLKEIMFIERNLSTWNRYFKESAIYEARPRP
jgi:hypothetical protein